MNPDLPSFTTHEDLPVEISFADVANDPDGDVLFYRIVDVTNGTAAANAVGRSVVFTPNPGYSGPASITVIADDGFNLSTQAVLLVTVSDAPLLRFISRTACRVLRRARRISLLSSVISLTRRMFR